MARRKAGVEKVIHDAGLQGVDLCVYRLSGRTRRNAFGVAYHSDIERYRDLRASSGIAAATVRSNLKSVRSVLAKAHRQGLVLHNVAEAIDLPIVKSQEREVFTPDELRAILDIASPDWQTATLLGFFTGARLGDVISMSWHNVDLARGVLFFHQGKTGPPVEIPIHPDLEAHLLSIAGDNPHGLLCRELSKTPLSGGSGLSQQFGRLVGRAGVDQHRVQVSRRRKSFHSLRHSFASALANAGVSPELRMRLRTCLRMHEVWWWDE
jgi:integrase